MRKTLKQPVLPGNSTLLPRAVAEDEATRRLVPVPPARVMFWPDVVVAFVMHLSSQSPAVGDTADERVEDAGSVTVIEPTVGSMTIDSYAVRSDAASVMLAGVEVDNG